MELEEAKNRLCALISEVGERVFDCIYSCDCFCGTNPTGSRIDEPIIDFIETAVRKKIKAKLNKGLKK